MSSLVRATHESDESAILAAAPLSGLDTNFCFPVREMSNTRVKVTPFIPSVHAAAFINKSAPHQAALYEHMAIGPFNNVDDFVESFIQGMVHPSNDICLFAIIDLTCSTTNDETAGLAGIALFSSTSPSNRCSEIGYIVFPQFQRTHVTTNAVGLMLQHAFDTKDGMGLRRVSWQTSSMNIASQRSAERMGFTKEGVLRWTGVYPGGKRKQKQGNGRELPPGDDENDLGRDTVVYSVCWDEWESGIKDRMTVLMGKGLKSRRSECWISSPSVDGKLRNCYKPKKEEEERRKSHYSHSTLLRSLSR